VPTLSPALSRDDAREGGYRAKPHPDSLIEIAKSWNLDLPCEGVVMVGDSFNHDVVFGKEAGVQTALVGPEAAARNRDGGEGEGEGEGEGGGADMTAEELWQLPRLLCARFEISGPLGTSVPLLKYETPEPGTEACRAAAKGDVDALLSFAIEELNRPDGTGNTPLIWAADGGHSGAVEAMLEVASSAAATSSSSTAKLDVDAGGYLGATALCRASRSGHTDIVRALVIKGGANPDVPNDKMQYPLHFAAFKLRGDTVDALLELGANTRVLDRKGRTPAEDTSDETIRDRILEAREKKGAS